MTKIKTTIENWREVLRIQPTHLRITLNVVKLTKAIEEITQDAFARGQKHAFGVDRERVKQEGREEAAKIVEGWHIRKGGYTELAHVIRTGNEN